MLANINVDSKHSIYNQYLQNLPRICLVYRIPRNTETSASSKDN